MNAPHISHSFYRVSDADARRLCIDGKLPHHGYAKRAGDISAVKLMACRRSSWRNGSEAYAVPMPADAKCEIMRTSLSWHWGAPVKRGWVWALVVH